MKTIFTQGRELIDVIEGHDWQLYDVTQPTKQERAFTWEELQDHSPANQLEMGNNYVFVPRPRDGQTLREAYSVTKGLGPSLTIEDSDDPRWKSLSVGPKVLPGWVAFFSRLFLEDDFMVASIPRTEFHLDSDFVAMPYDSVADTFKKYFRIVQPGEVGAKTPIPMPPKLD
jgi:hypothetical protein